MNLRSLAQALGGEVSGAQVLAPGPGHSPADRSMSVRIVPDAPNGFIAFSHSGDDWRACRDHIRQRLGIGARCLSTPAPPPRTTPISFPSPDSTARALALWQEAQLPAGTIVEAYLASRGLALPLEAAGEAIRFHLSCPFRIEDGSLAKLPTMLALMTDAVTGSPQAVHRTALAPDGSGKSKHRGLGNPKKMLGPARGCVVRLTSDEDVNLGLGITEGIETGFSIMGAGWRPVWGCGTAGGIGQFPLLGGIEHLTIFADPDPTGLAAAQSCQARWLAAGRESTIVLPPSDGEDWADVIGRAG